MLNGDTVLRFLKRRNARQHFHPPPPPPPRVAGNASNLICGLLKNSAGYKLPIRADVPHARHGDKAAKSLLNVSLNVEARYNDTLYVIQVQ